MSKKVKIGLETHLQLLSESKLFCGCPTSGNGGPNTRVCPTCLGLPGSKPRVNRKVIEMGMKIAEALNCEMPDEVNFSRKSYFYPDMPKNFQITQFSIPLGENGKVELEIGGEERKIRIRRIHLEEDPGKLKHVGGDITSADNVLVDYNRAGIPLCEIVTEPDLRSPEEARIFLRKLADIFEYLKVYDSSSEASIRSDVNISTGGERTEVKNITGFRAIERALSYEIKRQKRLVERGEEVERETRSYDDDSGTTKPLRKKEAEKEYGYIFEPDLTKIKLTREWIEEITKDIPELPHKKKGRYIEEFDLSEEAAETICSDLSLAKTFEEVAETRSSESAARIISGPVKKVLNYHEINFDESKLNKENTSKLLKMFEEGEITERGAELILRKMVTEGGDPEKIKEDKGLERASRDETESAVEEVIQEEGGAVKDFREGRKEALNFLMGKAMEKTGGSADPQQLRRLLKEKIED